MILTFRPIKTWPPGWRERTERPYSPFSASYRDTLDLLDRELFQLQAREATLQVDATERDCRLDGQLRADAKVNHPGVILTIETKTLGTLIYACDRFAGRWGVQGWQANLRAIALGLEALRKVERYGIAERGQQYAGYRELPPSSIALPSRTMTVEEAARFLAEHSDDPSGRLADVEADPAFALVLFREGARKLHPDNGGDPDTFRLLVIARDTVQAAFG